MHSTETVLLKVFSGVTMTADSEEFIVLVLLDLSVACDTIDHTLLQIPLI